MSLDLNQRKEPTCTAFMKSYVEKLKKERKRQNKKASNAKRKK